MERNRHYYETYSKKNPLRRSVSGEYFTKLVQDKILKKGFKNLVDFGCGMGNQSGCLVKPAKTNNAKVTGIDLNKNDLLIAKERYPDYNAVHGDIRKTNFPDKRFDFAMCTEVLEHVPSPENVVDEIARVTKDNANYVITVPNGFSPFIFLYDNLREMNAVRKLLGLRLREKGEFRDHINQFNIFSIKKLLGKHMTIEKITNYGIIMPIISRLIKNVDDKLYEHWFVYYPIKFLFVFDFYLSQLDVLHLQPSGWIIEARKKGFETRTQ